MTPAEFRHLRRLNGLTQEQAARILDVTHRTIMRWEHGDSRIDPLRAESIRARLLKKLFGERNVLDGEDVAKVSYRK